VGKSHLPARVSPKVIARLQAPVKEQNSAIDEVISLSLDALDRERKSGHSVPERLAFFEQNVVAFFELVMTINGKLEEKFSHASLSTRRKDCRPVSAFD
jgi:hypothetical protein